MKVHSKNTLKQTRGLSKIRVSIFAAVFALFGGIAIFLTYADVVTNPTHIVDVQWNFPGSGYDITSLSTDVTPKADPGTDGYFYATEFYYLNNYTGYMGLQANGNAHDGITYPKTALIEIYGSTGATPASGIKSSCINNSGEGNSCALHAIYNWVPGHTYRFNLSLLQGNDGIGNEVWTAKFTDTTINSITQLGTLKVPVAWQYLGHAIVTFHERFSGPTVNCSDIKTSFVTFANAYANGNSLLGVGNGPPFLGEFTSPQCPGFVYNNVINGVAYSGYGPGITAYEPAATNTPPVGGGTTGSHPSTTTQNKSPAPTSTQNSSNKSPANTHNLPNANSSSNTQPVSKADISKANQPSKDNLLIPSTGTTQKTITGKKVNKIIAASGGVIAAAVFTLFILSRFTGLLHRKPRLQDINAPPDEIEEQGNSSVASLDVNSIYPQPNHNNSTADDEER